MSITPSTPKMTYALALDSVLAIADLPISAEALDKLIALRKTFDPKADRKPTAKQTENASLTASLLSQMVIGKSYRIADIIKSFDGFGEFSTSKVSSLIRPLVENGTVDRVIDKRITYFTRTK